MPLMLLTLASLLGLLLGYPIGRLPTPGCASSPWWSSKLGECQQLLLQGLCVGFPYPGCSIATAVSWRGVSHCHCPHSLSFISDPSENTTRSAVIMFHSCFASALPGILVLKRAAQSGSCNCGYIISSSSGLINTALKSLWRGDQCLALAGMKTLGTRASVLGQYMTSIPQYQRRGWG